MKYKIIILILIICSCENSDDTETVKDYFLGQATPGLTPIRFAREIITNNFYPHSKLIISPAGNRIYWTTFLDIESSEKALYYSDFKEGNLYTAERETSLAQYGILSFTFLNNENTVIFGSLQPYEELDGKLVRAV